MTKMLRFGAAERSPRAAPILPGWGGAPKRAVSSRSYEISHANRVTYLANEDVAAHKRPLMQLSQGIPSLAGRLKLNNSVR